MAGFQQYLDDRTHDLPFAFYRLIGIGIGTDRYRRGLIAFPAELRSQQSRCVWRGEKLGFEVEPRREIVEGVGRAREAIDAAMLATPIRVDRTVEADVR